MAANNDRTLSREVKVTAIPSGDKVNLPSGTQVSITHRLGGNFTVVCDFGMFRIDGRDADSLGEDIPETAAPARDNTSAQIAEAAATEGPPDEGQLWEALRKVYDPEIPVNIVDLGLVYNLRVVSAAEAQEIAEGQEPGEASSEAEQAPEAAASSVAAESAHPETSPQAPDLEPPQSGYVVYMDMTLTAPGCGMGPAIADDARAQLESVPAVSQARVEIVWDPPWNQDMISEEGKMQLGLI